MPKLFLKLFAGQGTGRTDRRTDGRTDKATTICFPLLGFLIRNLRSASTETKTNA